MIVADQIYFSLFWISAYELVEQQSIVHLSVQFQDALLPTKTFSKSCLDQSDVHSIEMNISLFKIERAEPQFLLLWAVFM